MTEPVEPQPESGVAPATYKALVKKEGALARDLQLPANRVHHHLAVLVVAEMLSRAQDIEGQQLFLVKGGSMIELRLGIAQSRRSTDLDAAFRGEVERVADVVTQVLATGWSGFTGTIKDQSVIPVPGLVVKPRRLEIQLIYGKKAWAVVPLEVSGSDPSTSAAAEPVVAAEDAHLGTKHLGLPQTAAVTCISVHHQVAQKLHACTAAFDPPRINERARDLVDLLLLRTLVPDTETRLTKSACIEVFSARAAHTWPPVLTVPNAWTQMYHRAYTDVVDPPEGLPPDVQEAAASVRTWIAEIDRA